jgi:transcriptional regulator with XRE-family HTH domain
MFPNRIKDRRESLNLSQSQLARLVGVSSQALWPVEAGQRPPWPALRKRLASTLGCSEQELFPTETASARK